MKKLFIYSILAIFACSCTYSVVMTTKHGAGSDVVEDTDTASPTVSPNINIPLAKPL